MTTGTLPRLLRCRSLWAACAALLLLAMHACKAKQPVAAAESPANTEPGKPAWVAARPVDNADYIGIGSAPKSRADYQEAAKKNALNDLASEISVTVEGNSLLYTLDRKYKFDEEFTSSIRTRTQERLEGFELVGSYADAANYWVYYRLNKAEFAQAKALRKQQAINQATDLYARAQASLKEGNLRTAFDLDLRALVAIKDYWGENDQVMLDGKPVPLANELFSNLQRMTAGVRLAVLPERCMLDWANRFRRELLITASFTDRGKALAQLPITISYPGQAGMVAESRNTDADGRARTTVQRTDLAAPAPEVVVRLDAGALVPADLDPAFTKPLLGSLAIPEVHVPIDRTMPKVFFKGNERNLGQPLADGPLLMALKEELSMRGFRAVDKAADADLLVDINADTREAGESNGFFTATLDESIKVAERRSNETVHEAGKQGVKGIQLSYAKAGLDAYKKAAQELRASQVPELMNTLLQ